MLAHLVRLRDSLHARAARPARDHDVRAPRDRGQRAPARPPPGQRAGAVRLRRRGGLRAGARAGRATRPHLGAGRRCTPGHADDPHLPGGPTPGGRALLRPSRPAVALGAGRVPHRLRTLHAPGLRHGHRRGQHPAGRALVARPRPLPALPGSGRRSRSWPPPCWTASAGRSPSTWPASLSLLALWSLHRLLLVDRSPWPTLTTLVLAASPWFWLASTSLGDFTWALGLGLSGAVAARRDRRLLAGVLFALAVGCRASTLLLVLAWLAAERTGARSEARRLAGHRAHRRGGGGARCRLLHLPAWLDAGRSFAFLTNQLVFAGWGVQLGRWAVKNAAVATVPAGLVLLAGARHLWEALQRWRLSVVVRFAAVLLVAEEVLSSGSRSSPCICCRWSQPSPCWPARLRWPTAGGWSPSSPPSSSPPSSARRSRPPIAPTGPSPVASSST